MALISSVVHEMRLLKNKTLSAMARRFQWNDLRMKNSSLPFSEMKKLNSTLIAIRKITRDVDVPAMPRTIVLTNTQMCNLECPYCGSHGSSSVKSYYNCKEKNIDPSFCRRIADEAFMHAETVWLSLIGEPLLMKSDDIKLYAELCHKYGTKLTISTNGTLLSHERLKVLLPVISDLHISIDGASTQIFEACRKGAEFIRVVKNIKLFAETNRRLPHDMKVDRRFVFTICGTNVRDLPRLVELARFCDIPLIIANFVIMNMDHHVPIRWDGMEYHKETYNQIRLEALSLAEKYGISLVCPPEFTNLECPSDNENIETNLILMMSDDYYKTRSSVENELNLDIDVIQSQAVDLADYIVNAARVLKNVGESGDNHSEEEIVKHRRQELARIFSEKKQYIEKFLENDLKMVECGMVDSYIDIRYDGDSRFCCVGPTVNWLIESKQVKIRTDINDSNILQSSISAVFGGEFYKQFCLQFHENRLVSCAQCSVKVERDCDYFKNLLMESGLIKILGNRITLDF